MVERTYLPHAYLHEVIPTPRAAPADWIVTLPGGRFALAPADDVLDRDESPTIVEPGEVIRFMWTENYGSITVDIQADGSFTSLSRPDPRATCVWIMGDADTLDESVASFARNWIDNGEAAETVELEQYAWSDEAEHYRLEVDAGRPRLVRVEVGHG